MPAEMLTKDQLAPSRPDSPAQTDVLSAQARRRLPGVLVSAQVRLGLLTLTALAVEVVVARIVLDVELNFFALLAPFFVFTTYKVSGQRGRTAERVASVAVVVAAATVLLVYAL